MDEKELPFDIFMSKKRIMVHSETNLRESPEFTRLVQAFCESVGCHVRDESPPRSLVFDWDGLSARFFPVSDHEIMLEVLVLDFESPDDDLLAKNAVLLHSINDAARFTHGAIATVTVDLELALSKRLPILIGTSDFLKNMEQILENASKLRSAWYDLILIHFSAEQETLSDPGHFFSQRV